MIGLKRDNMGNHGKGKLQFVQKGLKILHSPFWVMLCQISKRVVLEHGPPRLAGSTANTHEGIWVHEGTVQLAKLAGVSAVADADGVITFIDLDAGDFEQRFYRVKMF
jgi:hypothetical protein